MPQSPAGFTLSVTCASHPCRVFCVARSSHPCPVFCITRLSHIYVVCSMLHVLCRTLIAHMCSVSRARRASVSYVLYCMFCVSRSSHTCFLYRALVAHIYSVSRARHASVARSSRICVADCASRVRRVSATCIMCRARVFRHIRSSHLCLRSFL